MTLAPLPQAMIEPIVRAALLEDLGLGGDVTSDATIPAGTQARASLVARESGVLAGLDAALLAFRLLDPDVQIRIEKRDGEAIAPGAPIAIVSGDARAILSAERTALNLLCRLSGIASETAAFVKAIGDAKCAIAETRKTTPGLRALEKYAVRAGGGANHRFRLDDAILIKDNHIAVAGGIGAAIDAAHARAGHLMKIEVEVDTLAQLDEVLKRVELVGAVLLDNFALDDLRDAVRRVAGRLTVEASGGVRLDTVAAIAATGVNVISSGALTHSPRALDIGLDITTA